MGRMLESFPATGGRSGGLRRVLGRLVQSASHEPERSSSAPALHPPSPPFSCAPRAAQSLPLTGGVSDPRRRGMWRGRPGFSRLGLLRET